MAEPNDRPAPTKGPQQAPGASGRHGEPREPVNQTGQSMPGGLQGATPGERPEVRDADVQPTPAAPSQLGSESAGGSVVDKRAPDAKQRAERAQSADAIGEQLRDASR